MEQRSLLLEEILIIIRAEMKRLTCLVIVIDALDECFPQEARQDLLHHMQRLTEEENSARLFVTSRPHPIIESAITTMSRLQIKASLSDIRFHITTRISSTLSSLRVFLRNDPDLQDAIVQTVVKKAGGMCASNCGCDCGTDICVLRFLLVDLHLNHLFDQTTKDDLLKALETLPQTAAVLYEQTLHRVDLLPSATRRVAYQALSWTMHAWRPMTMFELRCAIALSEGEMNLSKLTLCDEDTIISSCAGLIRVNASEKVGFIRE
jgi:hypothetical protein